MISLFNPYVIGGALLALLLTAGGAYVKGRIDGAEIANADHAQAALKQVAQTRRTQFALFGVVADAERRVVEAQGRVRVETQTIIQKVPVYVTPEIDRRYPLPCGFVRVHNAAAERRPVSEIAVPGCRADADPAPIAVSDAARVIAGNYGAYHELAEQVKGLQAMWAETERILNAPVTP